MDSLSQLELKDNVRPVFESPNNLNISFVRHMTCANIRSKNVLSVSHTFRFRFVRFLFGGVRSLAVNNLTCTCPVFVRSLCVLSAPYSVRESLDQQRRRRSPPDNFLPERLYTLDVR